MSTQACPNCGRQHDVRVFVSGQRVHCACGIHFEVTRVDVSGPRMSGAQAGKGVNATVAARKVTSASRAQVGAVPQLSPEPTTANTVVRAHVNPSIPGYELLELLGKGGMGEVWRARQISLGRTVAVKLLPEALAADQEFVARFDKEANALAALSHPNIVQIIDRGHEGNHYYFVMELVEGRSLRELLESGRPTPLEAIRLVLQIARALEAAHDKGIIHRDLKPENVLLDGRNHAKVADFGLAGFDGDRAESHQLTASRVAMGTLNYMAPEQRRDARSVDGRADLYSLGVVFYELFTGELPIGRFAPITRRVPGLDPAIDAAVEKLLENDPAERFATATPLIHELEQVLGRTTATQSAPILPPGSSPSAAVSGVGSTVTLRSIVGAPHGGRWLLTAGALGLLVAGGFAARSVMAGAAPGPGVVVVEASDEGPALVVPDVAGRKYPPNTNADLLLKSNVEALGSGRQRVTVTHEPGTEEISAHEGHWRIEDGKLRATQAGNFASDGRASLRPRAYVSNHYFGADDFSVETTVEVEELSTPFAAEPPNTRFAEISFRVVGVLVSVLAIPDSGLRMQWNYQLPDGTEMTGTSQEAVDQMLADHFPVPEGPFKLSLRLRRVKGGVEATGSIQRLGEDPEARPRRAIPFARKVLPGLEGRVAKLALGCRNLDCTFGPLTIEGEVRERGSDGLAGRRP